MRVIIADEHDGSLIQNEWQTIYGSAARPLVTEVLSYAAKIGASHVYSLGDRVSCNGRITASEYFERASLHHAATYAQAHTRALAAHGNHELPLVEASFHDRLMGQPEGSFAVSQKGLTTIVLNPVAHIKEDGCDHYHYDPAQLRQLLAQAGNDNIDIVTHYGFLLEEFYTEHGKGYRPPSPYYTIHGRGPEMRTTLKDHFEKTGILPNVFFGHMHVRWNKHEDFARHAMLPSLTAASPDQDRPCGVFAVVNGNGADAEINYMRVPVQTRKGDGFIIGRGAIERIEFEGFMPGGHR